MSLLPPLELDSARELLLGSEVSYPKLLLKVTYELALAHLRLGENQNCVGCHTGESCILPIVGDG